MKKPFPKGKGLLGHQTPEGSEGSVELFFFG
ncbi:MAG: hypothetical protein RLZZ123_1297 [Pseudomonadota bacterium]|jgi:hypothetical protein